MLSLLSLENEMTFVKAQMRLRPGGICQQQPNETKVSDPSIDHSDMRGFRLPFTYRPIVLIYENGQAVTYTYDALGRIQKRKVGAEGSEVETTYESLRQKKDQLNAELENLKPQITTLNHIQYNFNILLRDEPITPRQYRRRKQQER